MTNPFKLKPSRYDRRDYIYKSQNLEVKEEVDLREWDSYIEDQGQLGSCVGAALVAAYELMLKKNYTDKFVDLSKLYAYYHARLLEDAESEDEGVENLRNGLRGLHKFGICTETLWPYDEGMVSVQPNIDCYVEAWPRKIAIYQTLNSVGEILEILSLGIPVLTGLTLFDNFQDLDKKNAIVTAPKYAISYYGGHAMCLVGYNLGSKWFIAKNSWGTDWGDNGYCYIPFDYMSQFSFDRWYFSIDCGSS